MIIRKTKEHTASSSLRPTLEKHSTLLPFLPCVFFQSFLFFRCAIPPSSLRPTAAAVQSSSSLRRSFFFPAPYCRRSSSSLRRSVLFFPPL
ncbi:hypothetical protein LXL04_003930 [Taraxacum kok-saghyz]